MIGELPQSLLVNGREQLIRSDFRDALNIFQALNDPDLSDQEKMAVMLEILYEEFADMKPQDLEEAARQATAFLNGGEGRSEDSYRQSDRPSVKVYDWEQDEAIIFSAINKVAGYEVRAKEYLHWWTFLGYFYEIGEGVFSTVLNIRQKKSKGKKLEKWEQEFYRNNKQMCDLKTRYTAEEQAEIDYWNKLLGK